MQILNITVNNKVATYLKRDGDIVCGNSDYQIQFTFDSAWDSVTEKTARFVWNDQYYDVPFSGTLCNVPIITNTASVTVGVYAGNLSTTTPATIACQKSILCGVHKANPDTGYDYTNEAKEAMVEAKAAAEEAKVAAKEAEASAEIVEVAVARAESTAEELGALYGDFKVALGSILTVSGAWTFRENIVELLPTEPFELEESVNFTSGSSYCGFRVTVQENGSISIYYKSTDNGAWYSYCDNANDSQGWWWDDKRYIDFGTTMQTVSPEFRWFIETFATRSEIVAASVEAQEAKELAEEAKELTEEAVENMNALYGDLDAALDAIIATQDLVLFRLISGKYQFNQNAIDELGHSATVLLPYTEINFTASNSDVQFTGIESRKEQTCYYDADFTRYYAHESGFFDCGGYGEILDFGTEPQEVTEEFFAWVTYYMRKAV